MSEPVGAVDRRALRVTVADEVAEVTLLGPGKHNAMGPDFWRELPEVFAELDADPAVRAVVVTGSGSNFSVGLDIPEMRGLFDVVLGERALAAARADLHREIVRMQASINAVADCRKPVIAAVHGVCYGGGVDLIAAADIRYACSGAKFSVRETRIAIVADVGALQRLPALIGDGHVRELAFTGRDIDAARAQSIGLVNDVFPDQRSTLRAARATAREIAGNPPLVVHGVKEVLGRHRAATIDEGLRYVAAWNAAFLPSEDLSEALRALDEGRPARFTGQ
ncbi:crotonase/enoyl-CoA hydratase family protein [Nocardia yamanashiensis]|uniref:crotonase/enoyl-CoA hydratase family protein n=1 Tax=Nocardia yamanashiensis TaxID=209247 RepID=UPI00082CF120|nr:crotonase/enoyl-CoA hydratase family protein [Nocardia yamanashiensis]